MPLAIELMREAFSHLAKGNAKVPVRTHFQMEEYGSEALFMPVYLAGSGYFGLKIVGLNEKNPTKGLPVIQALVMLMNAETGQAVASLDGTFITALRTGAVSGLATQLLARKDAKVAAIFGAGVQAYTQLEAIAAAREFEKVWVFNRTQANAEKFVQEVQSNYSFDILIADSRSRLKEADVICTATTSHTPVFSHHELKEGVHINGVGSYLEHMAEVPAETVLASTVIVDQREACWVEAGDIIQPYKAGLIKKSHVKASLGEIVNGDHAGRQSADEITFFKSVGNAVQDLAVAARVMQ